MKVHSIILLIGVIVLAVFGIFGMHNGMQNHNGGCIAATAQGAECPKSSNPLDYFTFHLDAFKGFSTATFGENLLVSLFTLVLFAIGIGLGAAFGNLDLPQLSSIYSRYERWKFFCSFPRCGLIHWLTLHENSPAIF